MDFFPLTSKTGTLWIVAGFGLVSVQLVIRIVLIFYRILSIDRPSHLQTNRDLSNYLALHFAFGYSSMPYSTLLSSPSY